MNKLRQIVLMILVLAGLGTPCLAQIANQTHCGLASPSGGVVASLYYDPFSAVALSNQSVSLTLTRYTGSSTSQKTQQADFYFTQPSGSPAGIQILYQGNNVLYTAGAGGLGVGAPTLSTSGSAPTGTIAFNFGANTNTFSPTVTLSLPTGLDLANGLTFTFTLVYACNGTGANFADVQASSPDILANALILPVSVLDALQAYYAGPALDFGSIGQVTSAQVLAAPATYTKTGYVHVASSGPYTVSVASTAPNPYRMTYSGGSTSTAGQYIPYKITFLGQTRNNASPTFTTKNCTRAGVTSGSDLAISATLEDGGVGKLVGAYQDNLTVTITPLAGAVSPQTCS